MTYPSAIEAILAAVPKEGLDLRKVIDNVLTTKNIPLSGSGLTRESLLENLEKKITERLSAVGIDKTVIQNILADHKLSKGEVVDILAEVGDDLYQVQPDQQGRQSAARVAKSFGIRGNSDMVNGLARMETVLYPFFQQAAALEKGGLSRAFGIAKISQTGMLGVLGVAADEFHITGKLIHAATPPKFPHP
jgi:hypothetical protein